MFHQLESICRRPAPFVEESAVELWTDEHISKQMLRLHLQEDIDLASRRTEFINRSVDWIVQHFCVDQQTRIADFGCGPGLYTTRLAQKGAQVTGIDISGRSLDYARELTARLGLRIQYLHTNYLDLSDEVGPFDLIIMIFCDFCVLNSDHRMRLLERFRRVLAPGGRVLLDVHSHAGYSRHEETSRFQRNIQDGFWSSRDYYGFLNVFKYETEKIVLSKYDIVEADRARSFYLWLQCYSPETLGRLFAQGGLKIIEQYGDVAGTPYEPGLSDFAAVAQIA